VSGVALSKRHDARWRLEAASAGHRRPEAATPTRRESSRHFGIARFRACGYCNSMMKTIELHLARIGNSRGIRLPADMIRRHGLETGMVLEERENELVIRPKDERQKLSWEATAREMVAAAEDWSEWEAVTADGLESIPWDPPASATDSSEGRKSSSKSRKIRISTGSPRTRTTDKR